MHIYWGAGSLRRVPGLPAQQRGRAWRYGWIRAFKHWEGWVSVAVWAATLQGVFSLGKQLRASESPTWAVLLVFVVGILVGVFVQQQIMGPCVERYAKEYLSRDRSR